MNRKNAIENGSVIVASMYKFVRLTDYRELRNPVLEECRHNRIKGTILLAEEGINGTIAGSRTGIDAVLAYFGKDPRFSGLQYKESFADTMPFYRIKVKVKPEIVTMGMPEIDPGRKTGVRVGAEDWNALITDPDVVVIDTRNRYEHGIGTFRNSVSPFTRTFSEFPDFARNRLEPYKHKKIAMFCTGGIRCEKASSYPLCALDSQRFITWMAVS
jgi:Predicted sulfurtransferase